ncbi:hypothetical protein [Cellulomonas sp. Marseille-Q8402]
MTTVSFDVSYGTRAVPLRLPYLSVRRRAAAGGTPRQRRDPDATRAVLRALAERERAADRALAARGLGI